MSIENRVKDAELLWKNDRKEGAFMIALIAVAATARKRYPYPAFSDKDSFIKFLQDSRSGMMVHVEFRNVCRPIEEIFYKWIRCQLVHEGELPFDIEFMDDKNDGMNVRACGYPEFKLLVGYNWINYLIHAVVKAPENR